MSNVKMEKLLAGERLVVSAEWLDEVSGHEKSNEIRTCLNGKRVGFRDMYVAWILDSAAPPDLKPSGQFMVGSV